MKKVLLISVPEVIASSVIEDSCDQKLLAKTTAISQQTDLKPILGSDLFNSVIDAVYDLQTSGTPISSLYSDLLTVVKPFLIAQTVAQFILINNYKVTNKGLMKLNDDSATNLTDTDLRNVKDYYDNQIASYKSDLLQFLKDYNLIGCKNDTQITGESSGWFFGQSYSPSIITNESLPSVEEYVAPVPPEYSYQDLDKFRKVLVISTSEIISNSVIEDNVDVKLLAKTIQTVQEVYLKPILSEKLYYPLLDSLYQVEISGNTLSAVYSDLMTLVKPYMVNKVVAEFIIPNSYKVTAKGLLKLNDSSANALTDDDLKAVKDYYDNTSTSYKIALIDFIKKYQLASCYIDDEITFDATGWFFPKGHNDCCTPSIAIPSGSGSGSGNNFDVYVTGATWIKDWALEFTNNTGGTFTVETPAIFSGLTGTSRDVFVTGGTYSNNILSFRNNSGGTFFITGIRDTYITGGTFHDTQLRLVNNSGTTIFIDGFFDAKDLQQVTDIGNTTSNSIYVNTIGLWDAANDQWAMTSVDNSIWSFTTATGQLASVIDIYGGFGMYTQATGRWWKLNGSLLTQDVTHFIPDNKDSQTLALSVNGNFADSSGNIELDLSGLSGGSQDLQSVTEIGATTNQDIILTEGASLYVDGSITTNQGYWLKAAGGDDGEYNYIYSYDGNPAIRGINGTNIFEVFGQGVGIKGTNAGGSHYSWAIRQYVTTGNTELYLPNRPVGMIVLSVNGVTADTTGNVTLAVTGVSSPYITASTFTNNYLSLTRNSGSTLTTLIDNFTGLTVNGNLSAYTINLPATSSSTNGVIKQGGNVIFHSYGTNNMFLGVSAGNFTTSGTGINTGIGNFSLINNTTGFYNVGLGQQSLERNTIGAYNTALGVFSLRFNTGGTYNTGLGYRSLYNNLSGNFNNATGYLALNNNTTGSGNTANGAVSLAFNTIGNDNIGIGHQAMYSATGGSANIVIGNNAMFYNLSGSNNVVIGVNSAVNLTGSNNTFIGNNISNVDGLINSIILADGSGNKRLFIDATGKAGIGTISPTNQFHVSASTNPVRFEGLQASVDNNVLTVDNNGVVHTYPIASISGATGGTYNPDLTFNTQIGNYTLVLADGTDNVVIEMNSTSPNTLSVPSNASVAFDIGTQITVVQKDVGETTVTGSGGVTILSADGVLNLRGRYSFASLIKVATNTWYMTGDIGSPVAGTDTYTTSGVYSAGTITFTRNDATTYTVTGFTTGTTSSTDIYTTGGTYSNGIAIFRNNTGGTFSVTGFTTGTSSVDIYTTGATFSNNLLALRNNTGGTISTSINNFTGLTVSGALSATTISATTHYGDGSNLTNISFNPTWVEYTGSTITGMSAMTRNFIQYMVIGKLMFLQYDFQGDVASTSCTFTMPFASNSWTGKQTGMGHLVQNTTQNTCTWVVLSSSTLCTLYVGNNTSTATGWNGTGTRRTEGVLTIAIA